MGFNYFSRIYLIRRSVDLRFHLELKELFKGKFREGLRQGSE